MTQDLQYVFSRPAMLAFICLPTNDLEHLVSVAFSRTKKDSGCCWHIGDNSKPPDNLSQWFYADVNRNEGLDSRGRSLPVLLSGMLSTWKSWSQFECIPTQSSQLVQKVNMVSKATKNSAYSHLVPNKPQEQPKQPCSQTWSEAKQQGDQKIHFIRETLKLIPLPAQSSFLDEKEEVDSWSMPSLPITQTWHQMPSQAIQLTLYIHHPWVPPILSLDQDDSPKWWPIKGDPPHGTNREICLSLEFKSQEVRLSTSAYSGTELFPYRGDPVRWIAGKTNRKDSLQITDSAHIALY